ncbi:MAG: hypothetical protein R3A49_08860 [Acidimicrobiia bacterium]
MIVRRPSTGATTAPAVNRPGNGYGRPASRPGPARAWNAEALAWRRSQSSERDFAGLLGHPAEIDLTDPATTTTGVDDRV